MLKFNKKNIYLTLFAILYLAVAFVSTIHAVSFFSLANVLWMGIILAITFEVGQAAVLFSILTDRSNKTKFMPWFLMGILTIVQVLGNVFSSYKYLLTNSVENLKYFKEPIFIWTDLPDDITTVIVTYIIGAILPLVALCMTAMVTGYLDTEEKESELEGPEEIEEVLEDDEDDEEITSEEIGPDKKMEPLETIDIPEQDEEIITEVPISVPTKDEIILEEKPTKEIKQSHFINL